jgi:hypothetical protein
MPARRYRCGHHRAARACWSVLSATVSSPFSAMVWLIRVATSRAEAAGQRRRRSHIHGAGDFIGYWGGAIAPPC